MNQEKFEDLLYTERFIAAINSDMSLGPVPSKAEFLAKNSKGEYEDVFVAAMWYGWKLALKAIDENKLQDLKKE